MQGHTRTRRGRTHRTLIVLLLALAMLATTAFAPAGATSGGDDVETVRATVIETYNYKINLLSGLKSETSNVERQAVYQVGIDELASTRDTSVMAVGDVETLWALKDLAHSIYHETVAAAEAVPNDPAEELARAKNKAAATAEYKINLLRKWIEGCDDPEVQAIVAEGIGQLEALFPLIDAATTPDEAYALKDRAHSIYHSTMDAAEKAKGEDDLLVVASHRESAAKEEAELHGLRDGSEAHRQQRRHYQVSRLEAHLEERFCVAQGM